MPRQTRKKKLKPVEKSAARPTKKRPAAKVKPRFKPEPPPKSLTSVTRVRCPLCAMMTEFNAFLAASPQLQFYAQVFGGRLPAPRGLKPGKKSKQAPGYMEYREITDPTSAEYGEVVEVIKVRMNNISESILGGPLTLPETKPIIPQKRKRKKPAE